jgi:group I intron endonuclease
MIGIYSIKNKITNEQYIGSSINLQRRKIEHFSSLRQNTHPNAKLQAAFSTYGESNFEYSILEICSKEELESIEEGLIKKYNTYYKGYNNTDKVISGSSMQQLEVRQKHWGELHGSNKYSNEKILEVFTLLAKTDFTFAKISLLTGVSEGIVNYVKQGGHEWVWLKYPDLANLVQNRAFKKEQLGIKNSNQDIINLFEILIKNPDISFEKITEQTGISKETVSAVSSGRQFKSLILSEYDKKIAEEYYKLGRLNFAKKSRSQYSEEELEKCEKMLKYSIETNKWLGRDKLAHIGGVTLARKLTEFDNELYLEILGSSITNIGNTVLEFIKLKCTKKVSVKTMKAIDILQDKIRMMTVLKDE